MEITHLSKYKAVFNPKRTDDLQEGVENCIGKTFDFIAAWIIEEGPYAGKWAFMCHPSFPAAWVPECDLDFTND